MRRLPVLALVVTLLGAACADASTTDAGTGVDRELSTDGGIVVEGVDDGPDEPDDGLDPDGDEGTGDDDITVVVPDDLPDIDDLVLDEPSGFTFESTGDPCSDALSLVVGPTAEAIADLPEDDQQAVFTVALEPLGPEAMATLDALIEADDDPSIEEVHELITAFDEITLEPCGWPLYGALAAVAEAGTTVFCEIDTAIGDDAMEVVEDDGDPCTGMNAYPDTLPCFEAKDVDLSSFVAVSQPWLLVDCETGVEVDWDRASAAWVESDGQTAVDRFREVDQAIG